MVPEVPTGGPEHVPRLDPAERNVRLGGSVLVNRTLLATCFPEFFTCHVKVSAVPTGALLLFADPVTWMSVEVVGVLLTIDVNTLAELFAGFGSAIGLPLPSIA